MFYLIARNVYTLRAGGQTAPPSLCVYRSDTCIHDVRGKINYGPLLTHSRNHLLLKEQDEQEQEHKYKPEPKHKHKHDHKKRKEKGENTGGRAGAGARLDPGAGEGAGAGEKQE